MDGLAAMPDRQKWQVKKLSLASKGSCQPFWQLILHELTKNASSDRHTLRRRADRKRLKSGDALSIIIVFQDWSA